MCMSFSYLYALYKFTRKNQQPFVLICVDPLVFFHPDLSKCQIPRRQKITYRSTVFCVGTCIVTKGKFIVSARDCGQMPHTECNVSPKVLDKWQCSRFTLIHTSLSQKKSTRSYNELAIYGNLISKINCNELATQAFLSQFKIRFCSCPMLHNLSHIRQKLSRA